MKNHKQWVKDVFDRAASGYGINSSSFFSYFGKRLADFAAVQPGMNVLDVATGKGAVLFPLAEQVGPYGKAVGIDISRQMIEEARHAKKLHNIELHQMDAEQLQFANCSFDVVSCGFALFFLPNLSQALFEFSRVLKEHGVLAVSIWGKQSVQSSWIKEQTKDLASLAANSLNDGKELQAHLEAAGFKNIQIIEETKIVPHKSIDDWWDSLWTHGTRARFEQLPPDQLASLREKANHFQGNLSETLQVFYGIARK